MERTIILKDAYIYYTSLKQPVLRYRKTANPNNFLENKEYKTTVILPYKEFKELSKKYKSSIRLFKEAKEWDAETFKEKFKVSPPPADKYADSDGSYFTIVLRRNALMPNGIELTRPRVVGFKGENGEVSVDLKGLKVGLNVLIGNGSLANIQVYLRDLNTEAGTDKQLDLVAVQIKDLIEYEEGGLAFDGASEDTTAKPEPEEQSAPEGFEGESEEPAGVDDEDGDDDNFD